MRTIYHSFYNMKYLEKSENPGSVHCIQKIDRDRRGAIYENDNNGMGVEGTILRYCTAEGGL